ncbi:hypothetical protein FACS1894176_09170 [Bacteroidia bacterium]|nr:hypothetical protein FACS1894176_09170 [Bacteroidia bacterium]
MNMKKTLIVIAVLLSFPAALMAQTTYLYNTTDAIRSKLAGGRGYVVPFVNSNAGLSMAERGNLTNWTNKDRKAVWYLYQAKGTYNMGFKLTLTNNQTRNFKITCTRSDAAGFTSLTNEFSYTGLGQTDTILVLNNLSIPATGYYRYELESKTNNGTITINELIFEGIVPSGQSLPSPAPHTTDYLSSPSVHLHYSQSTKTSKSNDYDWLYQEVMAPTGFTPTATYWEAIGFTGGYFGMQANTDTERRILFSIWDQVDTDKYTKNGLPIPESCRDSLVSLVDKAEYTQANGFGNEGTGGQSYVGAGRFTTWQDSVPVKFLMNIRRDTIVSTVTGKKKPCLILTAWYKAYEDEGWRYVASWRRPFASAYFNESGSFIENFGWANGHLPRKGYYYNTFAHENSTGKWVHLNKNYGTHTDGATGQRNDYEHHIAPEDPTKFYMLSGGYGGRKGPESYASFQVPEILIANFPPLNNLELKPFIERVDTAMAVEKKRAEEEAYLNSLVAIDKTKWKLLSFSSQETSGEGTNGRAALTIDDKDETYWHSAWSSGSSSFPHQLVIDMVQPETVRRFKFVQSDGSRRWTKNLQIDVSDNNSTWLTIFDGVLPEEVSPYLTLDQEYTFRYFKLIIKDGFSDGRHTRLNEIYAYGDNNPTTAIQPLSTAASVYPNPTADVVHVPLPANGGNKVILLLKNATGRLLFKNIVSDSASESQLSLTSYPSGIYFIQVIATESTMYKVIKR